jgi:hypothetical protein
MTKRCDGNSRITKSGNGGGESNPVPTLDSGVGEIVHKYQIQRGP